MNPCWQIARRAGRHAPWGFVAGYAAVEPHRQVVVGAALIDGDRVLAAQRCEPPALAGLWEFPGGKVDEGETDEAALVRECREELGVEIMLGARIGRDWPIGEYGILRVWLAGVVAGELTAREHSELRWLSVDELDDVEWIPADRVVVDRLAAMLRGR
jgi:8-oxo-dGTP diphosphatase